MAANTAACFMTGDMSDAILSFTGCEVKVHKLILAQHSTYFKILLGSRFKEAKLSIITLVDDDSEAVKGLISHLYGLSYNGKGDYIFTPTSEVKKSEVTTEFLLYQVNLFIVADKYDVESLREDAKNNLGDHLSTLLHEGENSTAFDQVARHIYITCAEEAVELRSVVVNAFRLQGFHGTAQYKRLVLDIPELRFEVYGYVQGFALSGEGEQDETTGTVLGQQAFDWTKAGAVSEGRRGYASRHVPRNYRKRPIRLSGQ